ncbi:MAG: hypothetical protein K0S07_951 [Chlamydiales bacterium]|jgi:hypothetical protein|nr:hypothetical protein [Chlamydiales bacterium]
MNQIGFFTPLKYKTDDKKLIEFLLEKVDNYFYLGGKKACVLKHSKNGTGKVLLLSKKASSIEKIVKISSYLTLVIPLALLLAKAALRFTHRFKYIDPKAKLEKGLEISSATRSKVQALASQIQRAADDSEIEWLSRGNNRVFRLKEDPSLVFKTVSKRPRFANMVRAKEICLAKRLNLLIIPKAKEIQIDGDQGQKFPLIAEESLDLNPIPSIQEDLYRTHAEELQDAVCQLATFIAKTGFNDVTWRNIPVLNQPSGLQKRIALIDLEHMESAISGFLGDINNGSCGLIRCVSEGQIDRVIAEADRQGVALDPMEVLQAKNARLEQIDADRRLFAFYERQNIITGKEPLEVDVAQLGLDLALRCQSRNTNSAAFTLKDAVEEVIQEINRQIQDSSDHDSLKGKRCIFLTINSGRTRLYHIESLRKQSTFGNGESEDSWLHHIIQALIHQGHLFQIIELNTYGYFIQA